MKSQPNSQKNLASMAVLFASAMFLFASCSKDEIVQPANPAAAADRLIGNQTKGNEGSTVVFHGTKKFTISKTADEKSSAVAGNHIMDAQEIIIIKKGDVRSQVLKVKEGAEVHSIGKSSNDAAHVEINPYDALKDADAIKKKSENKNQVKMAADAKTHSIGEDAGEKVSNDAQSHIMEPAMFRKNVDDDKCDCTPKMEEKKLITEKNEK